jgi:hypothetical protein
MIVTGALAWWHELPEDLDACVRGLANVADRIVAVDGAYRRYPTGTARSGDDEVAAIRDAARDTGLDCVIVQRDRMWAGQVEKRSFLMAAAAAGSDMIAVVDTDHVITCDRAQVRAHLERANGVPVWCVPFWTPDNPDRAPRARSAGMWHESMAGTTVEIPHLYQALPGFRVEKRHWWYSALVDDRRHWLWGGEGDNSYPRVPITPLPVPYRVEHRCLYRTPEQIRVSRGFLNDREMVVARTGQEDDVPGLPEPAFDYHTMPA